MAEIRREVEKRRGKRKRETEEEREITSGTYWSGHPGVGIAGQNTQCTETATCKRTQRQL